jgi:hypothetical protein
MIVHLPSVV